MSLAIVDCGRVGYDELLALPGDGLSAGAHVGVIRDGGMGASDNGGAIGSAGSGGSVGNGGAASTGGVTSAGGTFSTGATSSNGGTNSTGGSGSTGGSISNGGSTSTGGITSTGGSVSGGATSTGGAGGAANVGCADGSREGFVDLVTYPFIAACDGGFALPGVIGLTGPACGRAAGDDGSFPDGAGCNAIDLCASGFHLCADYTEVAAKSPTGCAGSAVGIAPVFYATAQPGAGQAKCGATGTDDVYGCGSMGAAPNVVCMPLDKWSGNDCKDLTAPWSCASPTEALNLVKPGSVGGGVLCCSD